MQMKQITRIPNISQWRHIFSFGRKNKERVALKTTTVKVNNRNHVLDRIKTLEDHLVQVSFFYV